MTSRRKRCIQNSPSAWHVGRGRKRRRACSVGSEASSPSPLPSLSVSPAPSLHNSSISPLTAESLDALQDQLAFGMSTPIATSSRSSSPNKRSTSPSKQNDAQYRARNLYRANILVDRPIPPLLAKHIEEIISCTIDPESNTKVTERRDITMELACMANKLYSDSFELLEHHENEAGWMGTLTGLIKGLVGILGPATLQLRLNSDWREDLKPPVDNIPVPTLIPLKRNLPSREVDPLPTPLVSNPQTGTVLYPSPQPSAAVLDRSLAPPPTVFLSLKTPRPDMTVGLSEKSLVQSLAQADLSIRKAELFLSTLQETGQLITEPFTTPVGLCFPFFIIEAKSGATGTNFFQGENQAAVGGASALNIVHAFNEVTQQDPLEPQDWQAHSDVADTLPEFVFSVVTEGPCIELWVHYVNTKQAQDNTQEFCSSCVRIYRTTLRSSSHELVSHIASILYWGGGVFRKGIEGKLRQLYNNTAP